MENKNEKWEQRAKQWDERLPNLAKALRNKNLQAACDDLNRYGWIMCASDLPKEHETVLVTDGKEVWLGDYNANRSARDGKWALVYDGCVRFDSRNIIAWTFMPTPPFLNNEPTDKECDATKAQ